MKNRTKILLLFAGLLVAVSCDKSLELSPTSSITANSFWNSPSEAKAGVLSMFQWFRPQAASNLFIWGESRSGDLTFGLQATEGRERYFQNDVSADHAGPGWIRLYTTIYAANLAISQIPTIDFPDKSEKQRLLARAHTMRAYVYFVMARTWGGVPLVTKPVKGFPKSTGKAAAPVDSIFIQVKQDINKGISLFPDDNFPDCRCKWSKPAAQALKGDIYLWTAKKMGGGKADLQTALTALEKVKNADVGLLDNYDDIFRYDNKGNKEILMAVHFQDKESGTTFNNLMYVRGDQIPNNISPKDKDLIGIGGGLNRWGPSDFLRKQFSDDDSRKDATFLDIYKEKPNGDSTFYASIVRKYRGFVENGQRKFLDDVVLYRYAGVLLMIAEAKNALGQDPGKEINMVRKRAYGNNFSPDHVFTSGSKDANNIAIIKERMRELAFEGKLWWTLVRFGKAFDMVPSLQDKKGQDYLLLWPISRNTLSLNPDLEQNPGYKD
jgi:hypothetical protein